MSNARQRFLGGSGKLREEPYIFVTDDGPVDLIIRELSGKQAREFEAAVMKGSSNALGMLLQLSLVDPETHELLFEPADRESLEQFGISKLKPLLDVVARVSGLGDAEVEAAKRLLTQGPSGGS